MSISTSMTEFDTNDGKVPAYIARPDGEGPFPGVVVIQEWWGLNDHIKDVTNRMAEAGYVAVSPDLYRGVVAAEPDEARKLAMDLERDDALTHITACVNYLAAQDYVMPKSIGVMGFCMGGSLSAWMSTQGGNVGACVVFYGHFRTTEDEVISQVQAPLLGLYGETDQGIPVEIVHELDEKLTELGKVHEIHIYDGAPHAFFNDSRPHIYHESAAKDAWDRTLAWFEKYLV